MTISELVGVGIGAGAFTAGAAELVGGVLAGIVMGDLHPGQATVLPANAALALNDLPHEQETGISINQLSIEKAGADQITNSHADLPANWPTGNVRLEGVIFSQLH